MKTLEEVLKDRIVFSEIKELNEYDEYDGFKLILEMTDINYIENTRILFKKLKPLFYYFFSVRAKERETKKKLIGISFNFVFDGGILEFNFFENHEDSENIDYLNEFLLRSIKVEIGSRDIFTFY